MKLVLAAVVLLLETCFAQAPPLTVDAEHAEAHRLGERHILRSSSEKLIFGVDDYVELQLSVSPEGAVTNASPAGGNKDFYTEASKAALTWKYRPFEKNDRPVYAEVQDYAHILPPEKRPPTPVPFPEIADWKSLKLSLSRDLCLGSCPAYKLEVYGDGSVSYSGQAYVKYCGEYRGRISLGAVREIVSYFRAADYFWLYPDYTFGITDQPTFKTSIAFDGKHMSVNDYIGYQVGMPVSVIDVEDAIDRLAGPETWTSRKLISRGKMEDCGDPPAPISIPNQK